MGAVAAVGVAVADLAAVMGSKTVAALVAVVGASAAHRSAAARQLSQTMKKNGIRTKSCFKQSHQNPNI